MKRTVLAIALTFLLGPGAGHIYLRRFLQGIGLVLATLFLGVSFLVQVSKTAPNPEALRQNAEAYVQNYIIDHRGQVFYYDVVLAALWSYALVDAYFKSRRDEEEPSPHEPKP